MKKMKIWQRILIWALVALMVLPSLISIALMVFAADVDDAEAQLARAMEQQENVQAMLDDVHARQTELNAQMAAAEAQLAELQASQASIFDQKAALDQQINLLNERISLIDDSLATLTADIEVNQSELAVVSEQLETTYNTFKARLRVSYEADKTSYLSVLLDSENLADFFSRFTMLVQVFQNDRDRITELQNLKETVSVKTSTLEQELAENTSLSEQLAAEKAALQVTYDESLAVLAELADETTASGALLEEYESLWAQAALEEQQLIDDYRSAAENVSEKQTALSEAVEASASEASSLEASRSLASSIARSMSIASSISRSRAIASSEAAARTTAAATSVRSTAAQTTAEPPETSTAGTTESTAGTTENSTAGTTAAPATEPPATEPTSSDCEYIWPTPGYYTITSAFGGRYHPITGQWNTHSGVDIGASYGTPVLAIASGTVIESGYSYYFGNCIRIDHGNGCISLYGHFNAPALYAEGDYVSQGTVLGYVGSTGLSTGPHLHLTTYVNGVLVDPLTILP